MLLFMGDPSKLKHRKRAYISKPTGLLVNCPESVLKVKEIYTLKLWYELLYAPRSYIVKRTNESLYLQTPDLHIIVNGYIHFNTNFPNAGHSRQRKYMRINNPLYAPLPIGFEGRI